MNKQEIIEIAKTRGFRLDYDQSEVEGKKWMRFISVDKSLDEKDLRWIWYMDDTWETNINTGNYIESRLKKKKEIQDFLKYYNMEKIPTAEEFFKDEEDFIPNFTAQQKAIEFTKLHVKKFADELNISENIVEKYLELHVK